MRRKVINALKTRPGLLFICFLFASAAFLSVICRSGGSQEARTAVRKSDSIRPPASGVKRALPAQPFTIISITPDAASRSIAIRFSRPVDLQSIIQHLRFRPFIYINPQDSKNRQLSPDTVSIHGDFGWGQPCTLVLPHTYKVAGAAYSKTIDSFVMPPHPPSIEFVEKNTLIERDSRQLLHFKTINVNQVLLRTLRVPPLLLPLAAASASSPKELLPALEKSQKALASLVHKNSPFFPFLTTVLEENSAIPTRHEKNTTRAFSVPLSFRRDSNRGAIDLIDIASMNGSAPALAKPRLYCITDLGLTYKRTRDRLLVWTSSIRYGTPIKSVSVLGVTGDNVIYYLGKTDANGLLAYNDPQNSLTTQATAGRKPAKSLPGLSIGPPGQVHRVGGSPQIPDIAYVVAATQSRDDVSFMAVKPHGNIKTGAASGKNNYRSWKDLDMSRGYVFTERGLYKPGDIVYFKGVVRSYKDGKIAPPASGGCSFVLTDSRGNKIYHAALPLSQFGSTHGSVKLAPFAPLGMYKLDMYYGSDKNPRHSVTFQVQEFRPPRHFVRIRFQQLTRENDQYVNMKRTEKMVRITISASYYAGGPVKNGQVRWKISHTGVHRYLEKYKGFTFDYPGNGSRAAGLVESSESTLNDQGQLSIDFPLDRDVLSGKSDLSVEATVVDFDGRQATESGVFKVQRPFLVGIARHPAKVPPDRQQKLEAIVVGKDGKAVSQGILDMEVLKRGNVDIPYRNRQGDLADRYERVWRKVLATRLPIKDGKALFDFDFGSGGSYLLSLTYHDGKGRSFTSATRYRAVPDLYSDYYEVVEDQTRPGLGTLTLLSDKKVYSPGETATIFPVPSRPVSTYLVTVEQDEVLSRRVVSAEAAKKGIAVPILNGYLPNVYISVIGLVPRGRFPLYTGQYDFGAPMALIGSLNVPVRRQASPLTVSIGGGTQEIKARPGAKFSLDLNVADSSGKGVVAELAVGVVDESVLEATRYKTPNLNTLLDFQGPLSVATGELLALLQDQTPYRIAQIRPLTGGGGGEQAPAVKIRKNFKPVAYFNPSVITDASGHAKISFTLPDNMTTYRIYVVACDRGARFGRAERKLTLTKPFYLQPGLPAFFTLGDKFRFPIGAVNNTDKAGKVLLDYKATDNLAPASGKAVLPSLAAGGAGKLYFAAKAVKEGKATLTFIGRLGKHTDGVQIKLPVTSGQVMGVSATEGSIEGPGKIAMPLDKAALAIPWNKTGYRNVTARLEVSASPLVLLAGPLHYLLVYPYGCIEQISSGVIALAALRGLIAKGMVPGITSQQTDRFLAKGIDKIFSMQVGSGGFGYWPGYTHASRWGSLYAVSALGLAQKSGFKLPHNREAAFAYLLKTIRKKEYGIGYRAFAAYALSLCGRLDANTLASVMNDYHREDRLSGLYLVLADLEIGGTPPAELKELVRSALRQGPGKQNQPHFNARSLEQAIALLAGSRLMPKDPLTAQAADRLIRSMSKRGIWSSTADTGWALYALGQYYPSSLAGTGSGGLKVTLTAAGSAKQTAQLGPGEAHTFSLDPRAVFSKPQVSLSMRPAQKLYYRAAVDFPRLDYAATGHNGGIKLWKKIEDTDGSTHIRVGDVVKVTIGIDLGGKGIKRYLVLDDPLPAGFVAINSAFETVESPENASSSQDINSFWSPDGFYMFQPNYFEVHNRRVTAFRDIAWAGAYKFIYYARAVCQGVFDVPPTKIEEMYEPEVNGFTHAVKIRIEAAKDVKQ